MPKNNDEIVEKMIKGEIKPYQLEGMFDAKKATELRRKFIEKVTNTTFSHIDKYSIDEEMAMKKNIENMIGAIQIPLGFAGPLKINGEYAKGEFYIPLATTEGALVASVNRGCSVITKCGGATVRIIDDKMTRAPVIKTNSVVDAIKLKEWIKENFEKIKEVAESTTRHGKLIDINPILIVGRYVYPRFVYKTGDAMGMNMVTIATEKACNFIEEELKKEGIKVHTVALSGNACVDKKPSGINLIEGRGKSIIAEVFLKEEYVKKYLKTTSKAIEEVNMYKNLIGSAISNSMGFNAHYANIIGAIFLATGQDEAHIVEGSLGITVAEATEEGLYFSVTLPDVPIGTVGGGTRVEAQRECLEILGCYGSDKALKFAEIVGGTVLAGELSLLGALAAGHLAKAHSELGR
ncbi:hydroxymethylglutaryl-CoA reductase (NADPH) [Methanotorris formicicus]|uniref:3-hydroxy-3-methylglutaryl coenzyme A reductase n=1 Tax=Methanotorris formicicus Mc-S-70 TaxID=647171 RepID=H1KZV0_9EURY|nr:hydroxymethylglutaryl-CoA reductase (NADPH) [Methanotorris formicicus]EHP85556.1 3-hydroxy-3-methylglutaryl Coenzyme A reductase [Methanotorris formicicus Mc-S-70]